MIGRLRARLHARRALQAPMPDMILAAARNEDRVRAAQSANAIIMPPDEFLDDACQSVARMTRSPSALISVVLEDTQILKAGYGLPDTLVIGEPMELRFSMCAAVVAAEEPLVIEDTRTEPLLRYCLGVGAVGAYLGVPIRFEGRPVGAVACIAPRRRDWTTADSWAVGAAARHIEQAVVGGKLERRSSAERRFGERRAVDEERRESRDRRGPERRSGRDRRRP